MTDWKQKDQRRKDVLIAAVYTMQAAIEVPGTTDAQVAEYRRLEEHLIEDIKAHSMFTFMTHDALTAMQHLMLVASYTSKESK